MTSQNIWSYYFMFKMTRKQTDLEIEILEIFTLKKRFNLIFSLSFA